jgi:glycosyltransferase involved in cell wall biosynthesis
MKPKLLFISAHYPSLSSRQAGEKTAYRNLVLLAKKYEIVLLSLTDRNVDCGDDPCANICFSVFFSPVSGFEKIKNFLHHPLCPVVLLTRCSFQVMREIRELMNRYEPSRVHCEWSQAAFVYFLATQGRQSKCLFTINIHDVAIQYTQRQANSGSFLRKLLWLDFYRVKKFERILYASADKIIVPSEKDRDLLVQNLDVNEDKISFVPLYFTRYGRDSNHNSNDILFWGALNRPENSQAASILIKQILPQIKKSGFAGKVRIVGAKPPAWLIDLNNQDVVVTGFLEDPAIEFSKSGIAVFPLLTGAGVKVKVLECLSYGIPVITTSVGAEGLDQLQAGITVVDDVTQMAAEVVSLLKTPSTRVAKALLGISYIDKYFNDEMLNSIL